MEQNINWNMISHLGWGQVIILKIYVYHWGFCDNAHFLVTHLSAQMPCKTAGQYNTVIFQATCQSVKPLCCGDAVNDTGPAVLQKHFSWSSERSNLNVQCNNGIFQVSLSERRATVVMP